MLYHLPLERYRNRYTHDLLLWENAVFTARFPNYTMLGDTTERQMKAGTVLDKVGRPLYVLDQLRPLLEQLTQRPDGRRATVYLSDFFTPGFEALPYAVKPGQRPKVGAFWWAQSVDRFDFTWAERAWMRPYERMMGELCDYIFVACAELAELITVAHPKLQNKLYVVGLPYNSKAVLQAAELSEERSYDVVYAGRWDEEKQPQFFLQVLEAQPKWRGLVCTGLDTLNGTATLALDRLHSLVEQGRVTLRTKLSRAEYFTLLGKSKVLFNCAKQDWVSYTLLDGLTMGCLPVYPNWRSFPEALGHNWPWLYRPNDLTDAVQCIEAALHRSVEPVSSLSQERQAMAQVLAYHDQALDRIANVLGGFSL